MNATAPIIVDGANVAHWHGRGKQFSCRGLLICLAYFKTRGHNNIDVILPQKWQTKSEIGELLDGQLLTELHKSRIISYAPAGTSDDDFIIHLAQKYNAIIVTNDRFGKEQNLRPDLKSFVANRLLTYTFVKDDFIPNPNPLGTTNPIPLEFYLSGYHLGKPVEKEKEMSNSDLMKLVLLQNNGNSQNRALASVPTNYQNNNNNSSKPGPPNKNQKQPGPNKKQNQPSNNSSPAGKITANSKRNSGPGEAKNGNGRGGKPMPLPGGMSVLPPPPLNVVTMFGPPTTPFDQQLSSLIRLQQQQTISPTYATGAISKQNGQQNTNFNPQSFQNDNLARQSANPRLEYCMGVVMEIRTSYGQIETTQVKNKIIFYTNAYQASCDDLTMKFFKGKTVAVGYPPLKPGTDVTTTIEASVVCPSDELVRGYGKITGDINFHGMTAVPFPVQQSMTQIYCPANTFIHKYLKVKDLSNDSWVDFLAMPQYPLEAKRPFVSVNTVLARTDGVVVKVTSSTVYAWSRLAGFVGFDRSVLAQSIFSPQAFKLGIWLDFQLNAAQPTTENECHWHGSDVKVIMPKVPTTFSADGSVILSSLNGYTGFITPTSGNIYCNTIGRISIDSECLKRCESLRLNPMQKVLVGARFNNPTNINKFKSAWIAIEVVPYKFSNKNKSDLRLMIKDVQMTVDKVHAKPNGGRTNFAFFKTDKFGDVFAKHSDCGKTFNLWKPGDAVRGSIIMQELPQKTWRAFCIDQI